MAECRTLTLHASFDVSGQEVRMHHECMFRMDFAGAAPAVTLHVDDQAFANPTEAELMRTRPRAVTGQLNGPMALGATVVFTRPRQATGLFVETPVAECTADAGGRYAAFLPPGVYDVHVRSAAGGCVQRGVAVQRGLRRRWWITVDGLPKAHVADQVTFADSPWVMIDGQVVTADDRPAAEAAVLVTAGDQVHAHVRTDVQGRYRFALPRGVYTVRLLLPGAPTKVIADVHVDGVTPWAEQLAANGVRANRSAHLLTDGR